MEMAVVKSNLCPTCGGLLNIDLDKQIYVCPFCGVTFDYEYFREDNVKEVASRSIRRLEYGSANDAYDFMLAKDPHDFEALRGLFICKNKWQSMSTMQRDCDVHVSADEPTLQNAIENCLPEHRPYFEKVREALEELRHYRDLINEAKDIDKRRSTEQQALGEIQNEHYHNSHRFTEFCSETWGEMDGKQREASITFMFVVPIMVLGFVVWSRVWWFFIFVLAIAALMIGGYHLFKFIESKRLLASMVPYKNKIKELNEQYEAKDDEVKKSHFRYKALVKDFMDMDPVPQNDKAK